jgi:hypothetical protein
LPVIFAFQKDTRDLDYGPSSRSSERASELRRRERCVLAVREADLTDLDKVWDFNLTRDAQFVVVEKIN